ncbi:MAG TPA: single-stranded-DNA-specific exonuclease RecJ [Firmicutes bacterium]|nr:single-stranded-DNA-specific exonuclease RecJ [Bacillota bacterium]
MRRGNWQVSQAEPEVVSSLAAGLGISRVTAHVLASRGISDVVSARRFLDADPRQLHNPFLLNDMDRAATRVARAIRRGERIRVYGDYDVDGISATALLVSFLRRHGAKVDYQLPHRLEDGYGLHMAAVEKAAHDGITLLITVDCGITAFREASHCRSLGVDLVITDHHEAQETLPDAIAVVDPKRRDSLYPFRELAGVGVALKLAQAVDMCLSGRLSESLPLEHYLDLVALGTIGDVMPLVGENRVIARYGLMSMPRSENTGISALLEASGLSDRKLEAWHVSFGLAPRINAAGRLGSPDMAVELFLTDKAEEAAWIARVLNGKNQERQAIEDLILAQAMTRIGEDPGLREKRAIVLAGAGWHPGVIGIVASRLVEVFNRPAVLISLDGDTGRGSGRSIPGFDLYEALVSCRDTLEGFGGHELACGLTIRRENIRAFSERFTEIAGTMITGEMLAPPPLMVDAEADLHEIGEDLVRELERLGPYGVSNPSPVIVTRNLRVLEYRRIGRDGKHLKMRVGDGEWVREAIGFGLGERAMDIFRLRGAAIDVAFSPEVNEWNGQRFVRLNVKDFARSEEGSDESYGPGSWTAASR